MAAAAMEAAVVKAMPRYRWTCDKVVEGLSLPGKRIIVTGATSGIGIPTAIALARTGANVTITARDEARGAKALAEIKAQSGNDNVECRALDLASYASVKAFADGWGSTPIDVLLHNAGVMASPFKLMDDGDEQQQQVNFLSVVLLTERLRPHLTDDARVVIVSSSAHKRLGEVPDYLAVFKQYVESPSEDKYEKWTAYASAKSAVLMYANQLNAEFEAEGKQRRANSLHPGGIMTGLQSNLSKEELMALGWIDAEGNAPPIFKTPAEGGSTSVWCAVHPEMAGVGGKYCENCEVTPPDFVSAASNDAGADIVSRVKGTAPHVWNAAHCTVVTDTARALLKAKGLLA